MNLLHHDTTGTQTDCAKPLSRKKLKQLMRGNPSLTSQNLFQRFGRRSGRKNWPSPWRKREERARLRKMFEPVTIEDGTRFQLVPKPHEVEAMKPTVFERLGGMFANLRKKFEREKAKGK
jgi:hypothetical protein